MAGEDAKVPDHVKMRRRHCSAKTHQQVLGCEYQGAATILPRFLELQQQRAIWALSESLLRDGRPSDVPRQALQLLSVPPVYPLPTVQIDPPNLRHGQVSKRGVFGGLCALSRHQSQRWLPCPISANLDPQRGSVIASSECGMLELHLSGLGVCLVGVETAAVLLQNHLDAISDATGDLSRFSTSWRRQTEERQRAVVATGVVENVDPIEVQNVEMHVEPERRIHALHGANGTGQGFPHARETKQFLRSPLERASELRDDGSQDVCTEALVVSQQRAETPRQGTDPMPHRRFWQYSLLQVHAGISHTPSHTTRTEPSTFAAECDQLRVATAATLEQQA